jgi:hypothetical protein
MIAGVTNFKPSPFAMAVAVPISVPTWGTIVSMTQFLPTNRDRKWVAIAMLALATL